MTLNEHIGNAMHPVNDRSLFDADSGPPPAWRAYDSGEYRLPPRADVPLPTATDPALEPLFAPPADRLEALGRRPAVVVVAAAMGAVWAYEAVAERLSRLLRRRRPVADLGTVLSWGKAGER
jgi:hypothetical protein